jgi:hypothetical protein
MAQGRFLIRDRVDRMGVALSGLCLIHCLSGLLLVSVLGLGGELLLSPMWHRAGLAFAIVLGAVGLTLGWQRHGSRIPLLWGGAGLLLMGGALFVAHGLPEAALTVAGVALVAYAHIWNLRRAA